MGGWADYVYCPLAGSYAIVSGGGGNRLPIERAGEIGLLAALAAWRPTQGIYRFDPGIYAALATSPLSGDLPCDLLRRMPAWCVYIETPAEFMAAGYHGFLAHLEYDPSDGLEELRFLLDPDSGLVPVPLHLGRWSLASALDEMGRVARANAVASGMPAPANLGALADRFAPMVSLLLYLCSEEADDARPARPRAKRTKQGWKIFPPDRMSTVDVGLRIGAALRAHRADPVESTGVPTGERARPGAHVRSAHWHTFLRGPRDGEQERFVKWLPPIGVNLCLGDAEPTAVVRPVKG
jgi:hypothetical protein